MIVINCNTNIINVSFFIFYYLSLSLLLKLGGCWDLGRILGGYWGEIGRRLGGDWDNIGIILG